MLVKIHKGARDVVAICDSDLIGKKFEDESRNLDMTTSFFNGAEHDRDEVEKLMRDMMLEDASFNIVGIESCELAEHVKLATKEEIIRVATIPVILKLL